MKFNLIKNGFLLAITFALISSCTAKGLPEIKNAQYSTYNFDQERGYHVEFDLSHDSILPQSVVLNRIKQPVPPEAKEGLHYKVNVISQSRKIFGFKPTVVDEENGIYFKTDTAEVFKKVEFKPAK